MEAKDIIAVCESMVKDTVSKHGVSEEEAIQHVIEILARMTKDQKLGLNDFRIALNHFGYEPTGEWKEAFDAFRKHVLQQYGISDIFEENIRKGYTFEEITEGLKDNLYSSFKAGELSLSDMDVCLWALGYDLDSKFYFLSEAKQKKNLLLVE